MTRRRSPVDNFFRWLDKLIHEFQRTTYNEFRSFLYGYVAQAIISAFANLYYSPSGLVVNAIFFIYTLYGFYTETREIAVTFEAGKIVKLALKLFALGLDVWLNINIH